MAGRVVGAVRDLLPIFAVIAFFQIVVLRQPFPDLVEVAVGLVCVVLGLALFIQGLESGLFPLGEALAEGIARKGSTPALAALAFSLGFGTTVAEPALIAVAAEAAEVAAEAGFIGEAAAARERYAFELRMVVAVAVGLAIVLGVLRILRGWPIHRLIIAGYAPGHGHDPVRAHRDRRRGLRLRGRNDQHDHRSADHRARGSGWHRPSGVAIRCSTASA